MTKEERGVAAPLARNDRRVRLAMTLLFVFARHKVPKQSPGMPHHRDCFASLAMTKEAMTGERGVATPLARNDREAMTEGEGDCFASLAMTRVAMT